MHLMRALLHFPQQQTASVRTDLATVETTDDFAPAQTVECQGLCVTLCVHKAVILLWHNLLIAKTLYYRARPYFMPW